MAAVIFIILVGILYWSEHHKPAEDTAKASANAPPAILKLDASAITRLDLEKKDEKPIVLTKAESGKWQITAPQPFAADQPEMEMNMDQLAAALIVAEKAQCSRMITVAHGRKELEIPLGQYHLSAMLVLSCHQQVDIPLAGESEQLNGKRIIAFVQDQEYGRIQGAAFRLLAPTTPN